MRRSSPAEQDHSNSATTRQADTQDPLSRSFGSTPGTTTATVPTERWRYNRQIHLPNSPSSVRGTEALCNDVTFSAVSCTNTGELHERLYAPFGVPCVLLMT